MKNQELFDMIDEEIDKDEKICNFIKIINIAIKNGHKKKEKNGLIVLTLSGYVKVESAHNQVISECKKLKIHYIRKLINPDNNIYYENNKGKMAFKPVEPLILNH